MSLDIYSQGNVLTCTHVHEYKHKHTNTYTQVKPLVEMENTGLLVLLRLDKYEDLKRMYLLFRRVEGGLSIVRSMMAEHVKEAGRQLVMVGVI